jgi:hypothetical protein
MIPLQVPLNSRGTEVEEGMPPYVKFEVNEGEEGSALPPGVETRN